MLPRIWSNKSSQLLLVEMQNSTRVLKPKIQLICIAINIFKISKTINKSCNMSWNKLSFSPYHRLPAKEDQTHFRPDFRPDLRRARDYAVEICCLAHRWHSVNLSNEDSPTFWTRTFIKALTLHGRIHHHEENIVKCLSKLQGCGTLSIHQYKDKINIEFIDLTT